MVNGSMNGRSGQAMTELMIGMIAILALVAAAMQIVTITKRHTDTMVEARRIAGLRAMQGVGVSFSPDYIADWQEGLDQKRYTRDDSPILDSPQQFDANIVARASDTSAGWNILNNTTHDDIPDLLGAPNPAVNFGLVEGYDQDTIQLLPAFRRLIYSANTIDVESRVWMTWTSGMY